MSWHAPRVGIVDHDRDGRTLIDSMTDGRKSKDEGEARLERGTSIDRYVVLYELGEGGMGVVYSAYDPELDRKVALKLLHANSRSERARARLLREAKAIARISHPNVVTVHDVGTYEGRVFVAMEYVPGPTFRQWMQKAERSWSEALDVLVQAGHGLAAAHQGDLVHRDFKPDNVLVDEGGRAVVLDFGLARRASSREVLYSSHDGDDGNNDMNLTRTGAKLGTPAYMAPEQHLAAKTDARTDQFSFCVAVWEALYGSRPFEGSTPRAARRSVIAGTIGEPREGNVPAGLRRVLTRGLSVAPQDRYPDMRALLADLERAPRRTVPGWVLGAAGLGLTATGAWLAVGLDAEAQTPCTPSLERWQEVWDDDVRRDVQVAFDRSEARFAEAAWRGVEATLDRYTTGWSEARIEACEATHVHHEQSESTLELRMSCLRTRYHAVRALVHEFRDADAAVVQYAVEAVNSLPRLHDCRDIQRLHAGQRPPNADIEPRMADPLRDALVDARAKEGSARYGQALSIVQKVLSDAKRLGAEAIIAEAHLVEGSILERRSEFERAERSLLDAIWAAQRTEHRIIEAEAWVRLVWVTGVERIEPERGHLWAEFAEVALQRAGGSAVLGAQLRHNVGGVLYTQGRLDEALAEYRLALAQQVELLGEDDPRVATTHNHIGNALMESDRYAQSKAACERSLGIRRRVYGATHPKVAASLNNLGELERKQDHAKAALDYANRSLAIVQNDGGREEDVATMISGWALRELGRPAQARPRFERALAMRKTSYGPLAPPVVDVEFELARTHAALGQDARARDLLDRIIEVEMGRREEIVVGARKLRAELAPRLPPTIPTTDG